jgi:hypothetical protein
MKSQVSFKYDGNHNTGLIVQILKNKLENLRYKIVPETKFVNRIFVYSSESEEKTLNICKGIQCFAVIDNTGNI